MKKVFLIAVGFFAFQAVSAQDTSSYKPTTGSVTTEVGLTGGLNNANFDLNGGVGGNLKFRYFLKDDIAVRAGLGLNSKSNEVVSGVSPNKLTTTDKSSKTNINLGIEKHFAGSNRLSTYAGADLILGMGNTAKDAKQQNGDYTNFEQKNGGFGLGLFIGADYYIAQKVYLGVEAGFKFMANSTKDAKTTNKTGNVKTSTTAPGSKGLELATGGFGGIRLGFQF